MEIKQKENGAIRVEFSDGGFIDNCGVETTILYEIWQELKKLNKEVDKLHGEVETLRLRK